MPQQNTGFCTQDAHTKHIKAFKSCQIPTSKEQKKNLLNFFVHKYL